MSYQPKVNDYVIWKHHVRGWVYFKCDQYVTIEILVTPRHSEDVGHTPGDGTTTATLLQHIDSYRVYWVL